MDELRKQMRIALATVFGFYVKAHNFHWNVEGPNFYEYHKLFDDIVDDVYGSIDPLAEHIRTLQAYVPGSFKRFADLSKVEDTLEVPTAKEMISILHADNEIVITTLNQAFNAAQTQKAQGLMNFLADRIDQHQKWGWFLRVSTKP